MLFLLETNQANAATVAEHIRALIAEGNLLENRQVTVSIGVSELHAGESLEEWIKSADDALYRAKECGRNCAVLRSSAQTAAGQNVAADIE